MIQKKTKKQKGGSSTIPPHKMNTMSCIHDGPHARETRKNYYPSNIVQTLFLRKFQKVWRPYFSPGKINRYCDVKIIIST
jgi:hypothetical protein